MPEFLLILLAALCLLLLRDLLALYLLVGAAMDVLAAWAKKRLRK